jgi:radical SAM/Cys-rich protein
MPACLDSQYQASQNTPGTLCYIIGLSHPSLNSAKHMKDTWPLLKSTDFPPVSRRAIEVLQVNLGYLCNQSCLHCHVAAGPNRKELMTEDSIDDLLHILKQPSVHTLDLTGGAPEMNPLFKHLVLKARELGVKVIDRCNLTILLEPGYEDMAQFLADNEVQIVASLPCYIEENVDGQRGKGVYQKSIDALQILNDLGYSQPGSPLTITLVYNPTGPFLPPSQEELRADYKQFLQAEFDIQFDQLFTITNMPIARFGSTLISKGEFNNYMTLLKDAYSPENLDGLMCKNQLSVDWQGFVYDCDFNQMLNMNITNPYSQDPLHIRDVLIDDLLSIPVSVADHCYGCTAGQGSSCGGALG